MKPGYKTTEFIVTILALIAPFLQAKFHVDVTGLDQYITQISAGVAAVAYIASRFGLKKRVAPGAPVARDDTASKDDSAPVTPTETETPTDSITVSATQTPTDDGKTDDAVVPAVVAPITPTLNDAVNQIATALAVVRDAANNSSTADTSAPVDPNTDV